MPDFQPVLQRALPALLALLPAAAAAQPRPLGAAPDTPSDSGAPLGECAYEEMEEGYLELAPLEAEAVRREVLALCTERSEAIARFLEAQARLHAALQVLRAPGSPPAAGTVPAVANGPMEALGNKIENLRVRIARLEEEPEGPETEIRLAELRGDLASAKADLARAEEAVATAALPPAMAPTEAAVSEVSIP